MTCRQKEAFLNSWFGSAADGHWSNGMAGSIVDEIDVRFDEAIKEYTRAVPDVPELVRYDLACDFNGKYYPDIIEVELGEYVRHSQAAEVIAAKDKEIDRLREALRKAHASLEIDRTGRFEEFKNTINLALDGDANA